MTVASANRTLIDHGTMVLRLDPAMQAAGLRLGAHGERTMLVRPGAPVSERSGGGHYTATRPLVLRSGSRRLELRELELRVAGGKGTLRAEVGGRRVSLAKLRHATVKVEPGRVRVVNGRLRLTLRGALTLRRALRLRAIAGRGTLATTTIDVATTPGDA